MGTPDDVIDKSTIYMRIYFAGMPATMVYNFGSAILRAIGDTKRPLYFRTVAGVINAALNIFFVTQLPDGRSGCRAGNRDFPVYFRISGYPLPDAFRGRDEAVAFRLGSQPEKTSSYYKGRSSGWYPGCDFAISNVLIQSSVNSFGSIAMAGNTASQNIEGFVYTSMNALYQTNLAFTSQNIGAEKYTRIKKILATCPVSL